MDTEEIIKDLRAMVAGWKEHAESHYCLTYNKERGNALSDAAQALEEYVDELEGKLPEDSGVWDREV